MTKVYAWMAIALGLTGAVSYFVASTPAIYTNFYSNSLIPMVFAIGTMIFGMWLLSSIQKLSVSAAVGCFALYSTLLGVTLSSIFLVYTAGSIASTFFVSAGMFGAMSVVGGVVKRDLSGFGRFLMMGLIGFVIASVVNIFFKSPAMYWALTYIGVFIFAGLTVYDTQRLRNMAYELEGEDESTVTKVAVLGAMHLYLDFINLFLMLLRIFGERK
jgi:FtsH-binding integral membrane protein